MRSRKIGVKSNVSAGAKLKVSLRLSARRIVGSILTLAALYTPARANVDGYFRRGRRCQHGTGLMVRRAGDEKTG